MTALRGWHDYTYDTGSGDRSAVACEVERSRHRINDERAITYSEYSNYVI